MTAARYAHVPKRWAICLGCWIENFRGAFGIATGDEHRAGVQQRSSMFRPRRGHG